MIAKKLRESRSVDERREVNRLLDDTLDFQSRKPVSISSILMDKRHVTAYEREGYDFMRDWIAKLISKNREKSGKIINYIGRMTQIDRGFTKIKENASVTQIDEIVEYLERDYERTKELKLESYWVEQEIQTLLGKLNKGKDFILNSMDKVSHDIEESNIRSSIKEESFRSQSQLVSSLKLNFEKLMKEMESIEPVLQSSYFFFEERKINRMKFKDVSSENVGQEKTQNRKFLGSVC